MNEPGPQHDPIVSGYGFLARVFRSHRARKNVNGITNMDERLCAQDIFVKKSDQALNDHLV